MSLGNIMETCAYLYELGELHQTHIFAKIDTTKVSLTLNKNNNYIFVAKEKMSFKRLYEFFF
jgi:hypothetical protein